MERLVEKQVEGVCLVCLAWRSGGCQEYTFAPSQVWVGAILECS